MICDFCYRHCDISEGGYGYCQARTVRSGQLEDRNYGELAAAAIDPVEKKPLYHFLPGTRTLSVAMEGCSLSCAFCQNHEIAKGHHEGFPFTAPETLSEYAITHSIPSLSFTYTEPIVWQDYAMEAALSAKEHGLRTIMVTNGTFSNEALDRLLPLIDAYNIDLKGADGFYRDICKGSIAPVLDGIERIAGYGSHLEVTTLVIEGIHTKKMIRELGGMLSKRSVKVWHITPFYPMRRMSDRKATSMPFLLSMAEEARKSGIPHIYALDDELECPDCGNRIRRQESDGICQACGNRIYGVWEKDPTA